MSNIAHHDKHNDTLRRRHEDTGNWFLELDEFQDWLKNDTKSVLWCHGPPGIGKSPHYFPTLLLFFPAIGAL